MVVVIGPAWVDEVNLARLDDSEDYVRLELETAFQRDIPVIPILLDECQLPDAKLLPPTIQVIHSIQTVESFCAGDRFEEKTQRLFRCLGAELLNIEEKIAWKQAKASKSIQACEGFLHDYPNGDFLNEAQIELVQRLRAKLVSEYENMAVRQKYISQRNREDLVRDRKHNIRFPVAMRINDEASS